MSTDLDPPHHTGSEEERGENSNLGVHNVEIVVDVSIRNGGDTEPQHMPPVCVVVDRQTLSNSPVQVKIGIQGEKT